MPKFDEIKQQKKLDTLHAQEEEELARILSKKYGLRYVDLSRESINTDALRLVPEATSREAEVAAFQKIGNTVGLGIRTPNNPRLEDIKNDLSTRGYKIALHMVSHASLERAWGHFKDISLAVETEAGVLDISVEEMKRMMAEITSLEKTRSAITDVLGMKRIYRITRMLETILASAMANHASDVHIEPEEDEIRIRFRLDGVLTNIVMFDHETYHLLLSRIKLLSGLKINIKDGPQDGRFSVRMDTKEIEIRTSILPGNYGESIVLRILDPSSIGLPLEALGMRDELRKLLVTEIQKPNGMILNTGPTGSGKTTTLYAFLKKVSRPEIKVLTIEDPVEYHLPGIVQTQVNHKDYTFAGGLRSALRQDPDVIMVGEIRDAEVAETAVHAALTGHLVFSTLHTNNAAGAFPRLIDLGIDAAMVGSAVNVVMAQRLVRTLRPEHRKEVPIEGEDRVFVEEILHGMYDQSRVPAKMDTMWIPDAPEGEPGYKGRIAVYEAIKCTRDLERAIRQDMTTRELMEATKAQGILTMHQDAILKVLDGVTTLEEVRRVLGENIGAE